jgi:hypothetical protein
MPSEQVGPKERIESGAAAPALQNVAAISKPSVRALRFGVRRYSAALSSAVSIDFAFVRILRTDGECDSATRGELRGYGCLARRACFYEMVKNPVGHRFIERGLVSIRGKIKLQRFAFDAETVRHVIDIDSGEIRLTRDWANRSEIIGFKMNPVIPARRGVRKSLEARLGR